jgi:hypothetical protein
MACFYNCRLQKEKIYIRTSQRRRFRASAWVAWREIRAVERGEKTKFLFALTILDLTFVSELPQPKVFPSSRKPYFLVIYFFNQVINPPPPYRILMDQSNTYVKPVMLPIRIFLSFKSTTKLVQIDAGSFEFWLHTGTGPYCFRFLLLYRGNPMKISYQCHIFLLNSQSMSMSEFYQVILCRKNLSRMPK